MHGMQEVSGSIPLSSTTLRPYGLRVAQPRETVRPKQCPVKPVGRRRGGVSIKHFRVQRHARLHIEFAFESPDANRSRCGCGTFTSFKAWIFPTSNIPDRLRTIRQRLADHNAGKSTHTAKFMPWVLPWYSAFPDKYRALEFEAYLKSHSGRAFARKRLL